ncbi:hypothetical protein L4C34_15170 [Vibrio profundum]|uniref:hypothetical protein n=1 Tax=Vibrio profundum TaxID=2910247 RepID=UPI003D139D80
MQMVSFQQDQNSKYPAEHNQPQGADYKDKTPFKKQYVQKVDGKKCYNGSRI